MLAPRSVFVVENSVAFLVWDRNGRRWETLGGTRDTNCVLPSEFHTPSRRGGRVCRHSCDVRIEQRYVGVLFFLNDRQ
jgi:hypothetical protein